MRDILTGAVRFSLASWILCGILYPLAATLFAQALFPFRANGSLLTRTNGTVVGSALIGQSWTGSRWFHGRPSATLGADPNDPSKSIAEPYNASNSGGSNLGPTSEELWRRLLSDRKALDAAQPQLSDQMLPADMLTTSASGLDPDISIANAALQASRVAAARRIPEQKVLALIEENAIGRSLGIFGEARVNVVELNLALEHVFPSH
jgi:potassium-transporting ATPase KdpC subunit